MRFLLGLAAAICLGTSLSAAAEAHRRLHARPAGALRLQNRAPQASGSGSGASRGASAAASSGTTSPNGAETIVIVISTAGANTSSPEPSTIRTGNLTLALPTTGSAPGAAFNASSSLPSNSSTPPTAFVTVTPTPATRPFSASASASTSAASPASADRIAGMSRSAFAGVVVGAALGGILLLSLLLFGFRYLRGAAERREWDAYQNLAAVAGGAREGRDGAARGSMSQRDSLPMMRVTGANGMAATEGAATEPGRDRSSAYSSRWARSNY